LGELKVDRHADPALSRRHPGRQCAQWSGV